MSIQKPRLTIVVSGPSGAGKSTLCERYLELHPEAEMIVTTTTRPPRRGEENGIDYNFVTEEEFQKGIDRDEYLEYAVVHGHRYGSPRKAVEKAIGSGRDVILEIDVQGGLEVKRRIPDALLIFVTPSDLYELRNRLVGRGTDSEAVITRRLASARREMERFGEYNMFLFNDDLDTAVRLMASVIDAERHRIARYDLRTLFSPALLDSALLEQPKA